MRKHTLTALGMLEAFFGPRFTPTDRSIPFWAEALDHRDPNDVRRAVELVIKHHTHGMPALRDVVQALDGRWEDAQGRTHRCEPRPCPADARLRAPALLDRVRHGRRPADVQRTRRPRRVRHAEAGRVTRERRGRTCCRRPPCATRCPHRNSPPTTRRKSAHPSGSTSGGRCDAGLRQLAAGAAGRVVDARRARLRGAVAARRLPPDRQGAADHHEPPGRHRAHTAHLGAARSLYGRFLKAVAA